MLVASGSARAADTTAALSAEACRAGSERQHVTLTVTAPAAQAVVSLVVALAYDPTLVRLPETGGSPAVRKRLHARDAGAMLVPNNLGAALRIVAAKGGGLTLGGFVDVELDRCAGARATTATRPALHRRVVRRHRRSPRRVHLHGHPLVIRHCIMPRVAIDSSCNAATRLSTPRAAAEPGGRRTL